MLICSAVARRGGNQTRRCPTSTCEGVCGSRATLLAILASAVCLRIDDFFRLSSNGTSRKSRGQSDNGGMSWLFFAQPHTRLQSASRQPCRLQRPTGHLNRPRTRYLAPGRSHSGRAKMVDAIGIALAEPKRTSSASPVARPFFSLGSPTQICRRIPVKLSVDWNTCPVSS